MKRERQRDRRAKEERKKARQKDCGAWVVSWTMLRPRPRSVPLELVDLSCGLLCGARDAAHGTERHRSIQAMHRPREKKAEKGREKKEKKDGLCSFDSRHFTVYTPLPIVPGTTLPALKERSNLLDQAWTWMLGLHAFAFFFSTVPYPAVLHRLFSSSRMM